MKSIWWAQVRAVIRLEMRKTFFARRGLWIYVVALLPVLLFIAFAVASANHRAKMASMAGREEKPLTAQDMRAIKPEMTRAEVIAVLGKPPIVFHWTDHRPGPDPSGPAEEVARESYRYSDGQNDLMVGLANGKVDRINIHEGVNLGQDSVVFAGRVPVLFSAAGGFFRLPGDFYELVPGRDSGPEPALLFSGASAAGSGDGGKVSGGIAGDLRNICYQ